MLIIPSAGGFDLELWTRVNYYPCPVCGLSFQSPRLEDKALAEYYSSGMYRETNGGTLDESDASEEGRAKKLIEFLGEMKFNSVLDIGCSRGYFLSMTDIPYKRGVEIDRQRPFVVDEDLILDKIPMGRFDLITMVHYLEHDSNPLKLIMDADCNYLYIEVPSESSPGGPGRMPHLTIWTLRTLLYAAELIGAKVVKYRKNPHHSILLEKG